MADFVKVEGAEELIAKLAELKGVSTSLIWDGIGQDITQEVRPYPGPAPAKDGRWYQRGYGPRWKRKDGSTGGYKTSEQLGQQWRQQVAADSVTIENLASYAPFVHGKEQAGFHGDRGWRKLTETAREMIPRIVAGIEAQIRRIIDSR